MWCFTLYMKFDAAVADGGEWVTWLFMIVDVYDSENKQQNTTINLSLPVEAIKGTEVCQISAFGKIFIHSLDSVS